MAYPYQAEVSHEGLHKYRIVKAATKYELDQKVRALQDQWDEQWEKKVAREAKIQSEADSMAYASEITLQAEEIQNAMDRILTDDLDLHQFRIDDFKDHTEFDEPCPEKPTLKSMPTRPDRDAEKYRQQPTLFTKFSKKKMADLEASNNACIRVTTSPGRLIAPTSLQKTTDSKRNTMQEYLIGRPENQSTMQGEMQRMLKSTVCMR